jgi:hypothetical protein
MQTKVRLSLANIGNVDVRIGKVGLGYFRVGYLVTHLTSSKC